MESSSEFDPQPAAGLFQQIVFGDAWRMLDVFVDVAVDVENVPFVVHQNRCRRQPVHHPLIRQMCQPRFTYFRPLRLSDADFATGPGRGNGNLDSLRVRRSDPSKYPPTLIEWSKQ